jgi:hypothetical protein
MLSLVKKMENRTLLSLMKHHALEDQADQARYQKEGRVYVDGVMAISIAMKAHKCRNADGNNEHVKDGADGCWHRHVVG